MCHIYLFCLYKYSTLMITSYCFSFWNPNILLFVHNMHIGSSKASSKQWSGFVHLLICEQILISRSVIRYITSSKFYITGSLKNYYIIMQQNQLHYHKHSYGYSKQMYTGLSQQTADKGLICCMISELNFLFYYCRGNVFNFCRLQYLTTMVIIEL